MKLLKQRGTGEIYPFTEALAARDDMDLFDPTATAPEIPEPVRDLPSDEQPIQLAPEVETPTENSESASADDGLPPLDDAIEAFRRQASKSPKKRADETNG